LPEQILIHFRRRLSIAAQRELDAGIKGNRTGAQAQNRIDPTIENRVVGIAVFNQQLAGKRNLAPGMRSSNKPLITGNPSR
jgi:hypothetical protein